jgi:hypothetical protein
MTRTTTNREMSESRGAKSTRALRRRPTPKWLLQKEDLDGIARRRCLTVLSVLSGEKPVTEAIAELGISRGTYYQWEERALGAILASLSPGSEEAGSTGPSARIAELEQKVAQLERDKRRGERLLLLTRKVVKPGPVTTGAGRPPKTRKSSTSGGRRSSTASKQPRARTAKAPAAANRSSSPPAPPSIPRTDGGAAS